MKYKLKSVLELAYYVGSLSEDRRGRLISHINNSNQALRILNKLDELSGNSIHQDIQIATSADDNRNYYHFKKKIEEYLLTRESIDYLKVRDKHAHLRLKIGKRILLAQLLFDLGNPINACEILLRTYKKAKSCELLIEQKDCAQKLSGIYKYIDEAEYMRWEKIVEELQVIIVQFKTLTRTFNELVESKFCCETCHNNRISSYRKFQQAGFNDETMLKSEFMKNFIQACVLRKSSNHKAAQNIAWNLKSMVRNHPLIFSRHYYLILMQFMLENMYYLNKVYIVRKAAEKIEILDQFPIFQTIPLLFLNLYELFRQRRAIKMKNEILRIKKLYPIDNFFHIRLHLDVAMIHSFFLGEQYALCVQEINSRILLRNISCLGLNADLRVLEIICHFELNNLVVFQDRMESLRKFLGRNKEKSRIKLYKTIFYVLKALSKNDDLVDISKLVHDLQSIQYPIYNFQPYGIINWLKRKFNLIA